MEEPRYPCSHLVTLCLQATEQTANLEEIWRSGALLECEKPIPTGTAAILQCGSTSFSGMVKSAEQHKFGWLVELEFSPLTLWSIEVFRPEHLLDPQSLL